MKKTLQFLALYKNQTVEEQRSQTTLHRNHRGFNASDARIMSYYAEYLHEAPALTGRFREDALRRLKKYLGQLMAIASSQSNSNKGSF